MRVTWVNPKRGGVEWLGAVPATRRVPSTLGYVSVESSGFFPTLVLITILGLAIYGGVKAVGSLEAR